MGSTLHDPIYWKFWYLKGSWKRSSSNMGWEEGVGYLSFFVSIPEVILIHFDIMEREGGFWVLRNVKGWKRFDKNLKL